MGSIAMDGAGNIALGYSVSTYQTSPSLRYATHVAGDTLGTLQAEATLVPGSGYQDGCKVDRENREADYRLGDYSAMVVDPSDDAKFWFTGEYQATSGGACEWRTRIGAFRVLPTDLVLHDQMLTGAQVFSAANSITAGPNMTMASTADVIFHVTSPTGTVVLSDGFTAASGSMFRGFVAGGASTSSGLLASSRASVVESKPMDPLQTSPATFRLAQNYPNPFNPVTEIRYALAKPMHVTISVYNVAGQKIATLVDGLQDAQSHSVKWNGRSQTGLPVPSGIYLYRMVAGNFTETRKMILLK